MSQIHLVSCGLWVQLFFNKNIKPNKSFTCLIIIHITDTFSLNICVVYLCDFLKEWRHIIVNIAVCDHAIVEGDV